MRGVMDFEFTMNLVVLDSMPRTHKALRAVVVFRAAK